MCDVLMPRLLHHDSITLELRAEQTHPSLSSRQVATMKKVSNTEEKKNPSLLNRNQGGYVQALGVCKDLTDRMEVTRIPEDVSPRARG